MTHRHRVSPPLSAALLGFTVAIALSGPAAFSSDQRLLASANGPSQEVASPDGSGQAPDGSSQDVPWWPWILALPGLGALLWWRLREMAPSLEKAATTPKPDSGLGQVDQGDAERAESAAALDAGGEAAPNVDEPPTPSTSEEDRGIGAPSPSATVTLGTNSTVMAQPRRIILTPRTSTAAYAYWELPPSEVEALACRQCPIFLKLHDITDVAQVDRQMPPTAQIWDCAAAAVGDQHLPIARAHRKYLVELGYEDEAGIWHALVQSDPVQVPAQADLGSSSLAVADGAIDSAVAHPIPDRLPEARLSVGSSLEVSAPAPQQSPVASHAPNLTEVSISVAPAAIPRVSSAPARASLTASTCRSADAAWELSADQVNDLRTGKRRLTVRLYDVTELPGGFSLGPNSVQEFEVDLVPQASLTLPIAIDDRDYLIEVGYLTGSGQWQVLAKSSPVRVPAC